MFESINTKSVTAITAAALIAAAVVASVSILADSVVPVAKAENQTDGALHLALAKGDRLAVAAKGSACSSHGWPHYEPTCQFDMRGLASEVRNVRIIALRQDGRTRAWIN